MIVLDCRGMRCPWPAVRLARLLREGHDAVEVWADDVKAAAEIERAAANAGYRFERLREQQFRVSRLAR